jgi:hypothetical protein
MVSIDDLDDEAMSCATQFQATQVLSSNTEHIDRNDDQDSHTNLLKNRVKHLFIVSENGKPVFTR